REAERFFRRLVPDEHSATTQLVHVSLRKPMQAAGPANEPRVSATRIMSPDERPARREPRSLGLWLTAAAGVAAVLVAGVVMFRPAPRVAEKTAPPAISEVAQASQAAAKQPTTPLAE